MAGAGGAGGMAAPTQGDPDSWAQIGYDERSRYHNPAETRITKDNAATLRLKWTFMVAGFPPGSPVIAEGKVFVLATGGMYAIDLEKGTQVWARMDLTRHVVGRVSTTARSTCTRANADLYKLKASDGTTVWGPIRTLRQSAGGRHVVADRGRRRGHGRPLCGGRRDRRGGHALADRMAARGGVFAADIETGQMKWRYYTVPGAPMENGAMVWSSVAVDVAAGAVYATTGNNWDVAGPNSDAFHAIDLGDRHAALEEAGACGRRLELDGRRHGPGHGLRRQPDRRRVRRPQDGRGRRQGLRVLGARSR